MEIAIKKLNKQNIFIRCEDFDIMNLDIPNLVKKYLFKKTPFA